MMSYPLSESCFCQISTRSACLENDVPDPHLHYAKVLQAQQQALEGKIAGFLKGKKAPGDAAAPDR